MHEAASKGIVIMLLFYESNIWIEGKVVLYQNKKYHQCVITEQSLPP